MLSCLAKFVVLEKTLKNCLIMHIQPEYHADILEAVQLMHMI